ncbi:MAG: GNAT family N-acetyltransferase [Alphaproteobacteria bacterium]|nr:GNAT family N-acetyltransferase [Alphaproteobacteria bacterium]
MKNLKQMLFCRQYGVYEISEEKKELLGAFMRKLNWQEDELFEEYLDCLSVDNLFKTLMEAKKPEAERARQFRKPMPTKTYIITDKGRTIAGVFNITPTKDREEAIKTDGNIDCTVAPDYRERGIGTFALAAGLYLLNNKYNMSEAIISVGEYNKKAINLIANAGGKYIESARPNQDSYVFDSWDKCPFNNYYAIYTNRGR